jgi:iron complex transport system substrate-binding protein
MRPGIPLLIVPLLLAAHCAAAAGAPQRVMSLSSCTDDLLLELLPAERITSLSWYARSRANLHWWPQAARIAVNAGSAEEVLAQRPDLVLAGTYTTPATRAILKRTSIPLLEVPPAENFEKIRAVTRTVARALGEGPDGERLIGRMDRILTELHASRPAVPVRVAGWGEGGSVPGRDTLFDAILTAAGGINIAAGSQGFRSFDLERLVLAKPDVIAYPGSVDETPGRNTELAHHPLLRKAYGDRIVTYTAAPYTCGVVESADAALLLAATLRAALQPSP